MNNEFYILILTKGVVKMNIKDVPFTQEVIKDAIGNGEVEFFNFSPNSKSGIKNLEMKIYYPNGQRKVIILHDYGVQIRSEEVNVNLFNNREERNKEILRLYTEKNLSQAFLANLFGLSQPAISVIIKNTQAEKACK